MSGRFPPPDVVIAGGGLAGAATAFFLGRERGVRVMLLEMEPRAAQHSSGRSAGLVRRASGDRRLDPLCDEGAAFVAAPPADFPADPRFRRTGSFLLVPEANASEWARAGVRRVEHDELASAVPPFRPGPGSAVLHTRNDGVVDAAALVEGFLAGARAHGVEVRMAARAAAILTEGSRIVGVRCGSERIDCALVVDAAGAWAGELAGSAGADAPALRPTRRHLAVTAPEARVDPRWPWVWDTARAFYFRPEAGGLLLCACDEQPDRPGDCAADPGAAREITAGLARCLPAFAGAQLVRLWAGHRTRQPDGRFLLGADPRVGGLIWAAGLGGHGVTTAAAVGRRVAEATLAALRAAR